MGVDIERMYAGQILVVVFVVGFNEVGSSSAIEAAWTGSVQGRELMDGRFLPAVMHLLSCQDLLYLITIAGNNPGVRQVFLMWLI